MNTENLSTLKINKLTQEQYDREYVAGNIDGTALYLTPDIPPYIISNSAPSDTNLLWVDTTDTTSDFEPLVVDATLTNRGEAAESKATGDAINELVSEINDLNKKIYVGSTEPTDIADGTIWIDTSEV